MGDNKFFSFEDGLLVLDEDRRRVYRLPAELIPEAEAALGEPASSTSRRRFLHALAAGSIAGAIIISLPSAAAASSLGGIDPGGGSDPGGGGSEPPPVDAEPGGTPDPTLDVTNVEAGDGTVKLDWSDTA